MSNLEDNIKEKKNPAIYDFKDAISGNAAIFCSDERFIGASLSFLKDVLNFESFDLIVTAGGPAFINVGTTALMDNLRLLCEEHKLKKLILISHEDCKYYSRKYKNGDKVKITDCQLKDLAEAMNKLAVLFPEMKVESYFARINEDKIAFIQY
jgi:hypothetical protein